MEIQHIFIFQLRHRFSFYNNWFHARNKSFTIKRNLLIQLANGFYDPFKAVSFITMCNLRSDNIIILATVTGATRRLLMGLEWISNLKS